MLDELIYIVYSKFSHWNEEGKKTATVGCITLDYLFILICFLESYAERFYYR